jgi:hypothetical protein
LVSAGGIVYAALTVLFGAFTRADVAIFFSRKSAPAISETE